MYIAAFSGLILMFMPVTKISSYVTADNELSAEATVLKETQKNVHKFRNLLKS